MHEESYHFCLLTATYPLPVTFSRLLLHLEQFVSELFTQPCLCLRSNFLLTAQSAEYPALRLFIRNVNDQASL